MTNEKAKSSTRNQTLTRIAGAGAAAIAIGTVTAFARKRAADQAAASPWSAMSDDLALLLKLQARIIGRLPQSLASMTRAGNDAESAMIGQEQRTIYAATAAIGAVGAAASERRAADLAEACSNLAALVAAAKREHACPDEQLIFIDLEHALVAASALKAIAEDDKKSAGKSKM